MDDNVKLRTKDEITLFGIPASPGVAHGQVFRFLHEEVEVLNYAVKEVDHPQEIARFKEALSITHDQIKEIREGVAKNLGEKEADNSIMKSIEKTLFDKNNRTKDLNGERNTIQCAQAVLDNL